MASTNPGTMVKKDTCVKNASNGTFIKTVAPQPQPPDGGWGWMVVVGAVLTGALVPSLFMCFGIFMNNILEVFPNTTKATLSWIPSIMNSIMNCMGPITSVLVNFYSARIVTFAGGVVLSLGLILSYFTTTIQQLYLTYGVLGGIGGGLAFVPGLYMISQYFKEHRGLATGICMSGSSLGQITLPYIIQYLLDKYEYTGCLLIMGGLVLNICVSAALYRPLEAPTPPRKPFNHGRRRSSLTFIPEEGVLPLTPKDNVARTLRQQHLDLSKKSKRKKKGKSKQKKAGTSGNNKPRPDDMSWRSLIQHVETNSMLNTPTKCRSRTMSLDSSHILPEIPEELEENHDDTSNLNETASICNGPEEEIKPKKKTFKEDTDSEIKNSFADDKIIPMTKVQEQWSDTSEVVKKAHEDSESEECVLLINSNSEATKVKASTEIMKNNKFYHTEKDSEEKPNTSDELKICNEEDTSQPGTHIATDDRYENILLENIPKQCLAVSATVANAFPRRNSDGFLRRNSGGFPRRNSGGFPRRNSFGLSRRNSDGYQEVVTLHNIFGSVASMVALDQMETGEDQSDSFWTKIKQNMGLAYLKQPIFYILTSSFTFIVVALVNYGMYLPTYGMAIQLSKDDSASLISFFAIASMVGRLSFPTLSDYVHVRLKHIYMSSCFITFTGILLTSFATGYTFLLISLLLTGFGTGGCLGSSINVFLDYIPVDKFAAFFGLTQLIVGIVVLFSAPLIGLLVDVTGSYFLTFWILSALSGFSGLFVYLDIFVTEKPSADKDTDSNV